MPTVCENTWSSERNIKQGSEVIEHSNTKAISLSVVNKRANVNTAATICYARAHSQCKITCKRVFLNP